MVEEIVLNAESKMSQSVESLKNELTKLRTGRANPSLVDSIKIDYFGTPTPVKQMAQISVPDARTLQISCWDQSSIPLIEKGIIAANIGLTPNVDGKIIRLSIPPLSEDRRKDVAKSVKKLGEDSKIAIRHARRDANDTIKGIKDLPEDQVKKDQERVQKLTDSFVKDVDAIIEKKTQDILTL